MVIFCGLLKIWNIRSKLCSHHFQFTDPGFYRPTMGPFLHAQKEACSKIPVQYLVYRITERIIRYRISQIQSIRLSSSSSKVLRRTKGGGLLGIGGRLRPKELERFTMAGRVRCGVKPLEGPPLPTIGVFPVIPRLKQTNKHFSIIQFPNSRLH